MYQGHPNFAAARDARKEGNGAIRNLFAFLERLGAKGLNSQAAWAKLKELMPRFLGVSAAQGSIADIVREQIESA